MRRLSGPLAALWVLSWASAPSVRAQPLATPPAQERGTVLVLIPVQPGRPLFDLFARGVANEFIRTNAPAVLSFEHLYGVSDSRTVADRQIDFVRAKYRDVRIDAIIALAHPQYLQVRERLDLPRTAPLIFIGEQASRRARPPHAAFIDVTDTLVDSWAFMRPLFPRHHHVAVLGGSAPADRMTSRATLAAMRERVGEARVIDLTNLALSEMPARVGRLPADTVLLLDSAVADRTGRPITARSVLATIKPTLRVATLVSNDAMLGEGVLGGTLYRVEDLGTQAARLAARILEGTPPDTVPVQRLAATPIIDARELERLGISESRVPPGTTLLWRHKGLWEAYRAWILGGISVFMLQTALIAGLLAERRRRRATQRALAERLRVQALVAEISTDFANLRSDGLDTRIADSLERLAAALEAEDCALWTLRWGQDRPQRVSGWPDTLGVPEAGSLVEDALLTWARPRLERGEEVQIQDLVEFARDTADAPSRRPGPATWLLLPVRVEAEVIGVLTLRHARAQEWSAPTLVDLRTIGEIIATAFVRKRTDAAMRRQLETLAHVNRVASLGELAASLAHELNQPLAAILSNAEVAQHLLEGHDPPVEELRAIIADVIADDERAGGIIRNMRSMLRRHDIDATPIDVNAVATEITRLVAHDAQLRGGSLDVELGAALPPVTIDAIQLKQVLLNLVVNAVDAMAAIRVRRAVSLSTRASDGGVLIQVRDHGPGIPAHALPRLFDAFFTTKPDGLGVGLAISRSILEAAGGRIRAENMPDGGARFLVWLPGSTATSRAERAAAPATGVTA